MKKKKYGSRIFAALTASLIFLNSMTAIAAEPPEKVTQDPKWSDAFALMDYVYDNCYQFAENDAGNWEWLDVADVSSELPYFKEGMRLASAPKEQAYSAFIDENNGTKPAFHEDNHGEAENALTGDAANSYSNFYDAGVALAGSVKTATGTKYIDDIVGTWDSFWEEYDKLFWDKITNGEIIVVESAGNAPDTASMNPGTYWVLEADMARYSDVVGDENAVWNSWEENGLWEAHNGGPDIERSELLSCLNLVTSAYNTLLETLHEGTKGTQPSAPATSLTPSEKKEEKDSSSSTKESASETAVEEAPAPVIVNEVVFSNGAKKQSSLEGVYGNTFVSGAVYQDEQNKIKQAADLTNEEIQAGTTVKYYICNSLDKTMNEKLSKEVTAQGYRTLGVMKNDLYKMKKSDIRLIKTTSETLTVVLGVPSYLKNGQYDFVIFCYDENGNLVELKDTDMDNSTITVQARNFGYWAVGYKNKQ